jgi:hypothetical protein
MSRGRGHVYTRGLAGYALLFISLTAPGALTHAAEKPPRFHVHAPPGAVTFVVYGDTRFTERPRVANETARRALVAGIAGENPAAILIGGDLVYQGSEPDDYAAYRGETAAWARQKIPVFPALGNHEFKGCSPGDADSACLENWWKSFEELRSHRWYSLTIGESLLALILDSDSSLKPGSDQRTWLEREVGDTASDKRVRFLLIVLHYPPVRDSVFPRGKDEAEVERYLSATAPGLPARVIVVGSHVHNYERFNRGGVAYLVSGGGGAKPHPDFRASDELSGLATAVNFHYLRFTLQGERLVCAMVRYEADETATDRWSEPDRFEVSAK